MTPSHIRVALALASDPLNLGFRMALSLPDPQQRVECLCEVLSLAQVRVEATTAREIYHLSEELQARYPAEAQQLLACLPGIGLPAAGWMRAALLEGQGNHAEAAVVLDAIPDPAEGELNAIRQLARSRNLLKAGLYSQATQALSQAIKLTNSYRNLAAADRLLRQLAEHQQGPPKRLCKLALVGSATFDLLVPALRAACFAAGVNAEIYQGAFNQCQQEILDPSSGLAKFGPEVVVIALDWRALGLPDESEHAATACESVIAMFRNLWTHCRERLGAYVIQHNVEVPSTDPYGHLSAALPAGRGRLLRQINLGLWEAAQAQAGVVVLDIDQASSIFGKHAWDNAAQWHTAKQYPATEAIPFLVRHQVALLRAVLGLSCKCLVMDLDGTLWGGVVAEEGLAGIQLGSGPDGEAFVAFQRYVKALRQRGVVLAACSKNNEEDAKLPFQAHPEMVLSLEDWAVFVANWLPKDENLRRIAQSLNLGLDSLVFVDNSPTERAWIRRQLPEVETVEMPEDPALFIQALDRPRYFEALSLTREDRFRAEAYRSNLARQELAAGTTNLDEFLAGLAMRVELRPFEEANIPRITQLINKTNQFNLTTRRLTENQVRALMNRPDCYTQSMRLCDRFGDNGLTGVLVALPEHDTLRIDLWLMSCRVLGRRVEEVMLASLVEYGRVHGFRQLRGEYIRTPKNAVVRDLFDRLHFARVQEGPEEVCAYRLNLAESRSVPDYFQVDDRTLRSPVSAAPQHSPSA